MIGRHSYDRPMTCTPLTSCVWFSLWICNLVSRENPGGGGGGGGEDP